jgi:hypothetical protein
MYSKSHDSSVAETALFFVLALRLAKSSRATKRLSTVFSTSLLLENHFENPINRPSVILQVGVVLFDFSVPLDICRSDVCRSDVCPSDVCRSDICRSDVCRSDVCPSDVCPSDVCSSDRPSDILQVGVVLLDFSVPLYVCPSDICPLDDDAANFAANEYAFVSCFAGTYICPFYHFTTMLQILPGT